MKNQNQENQNTFQVRPEAIDLMVDNGLGDTVVEGNVFMYQPQEGKPPKEVRFPGLVGLKYKNSDKPLATVGGRYHVIQNYEFAEIALRIADIVGSPVSNVTSYKDGARLRIAIKKEGSKIKYSGGRLAGDVVDRFIHIETSHDGTAGLNWGISNVVLSCTNGMTVTKKGYNVSFRHTPNWAKNVELSLDAFTKVAEKEENIWETIQAMNSYGVNQKMVDGFVEAVFPNYKTGGKNAAKTKNMVDRFNQIVATEMEEKGANLWGMFNGLTYYNTHERGYKEESRKLANAAGSYAKQSTEIFFGLREALKKQSNTLDHMAASN